MYSTLEDALDNNELLILDVDVKGGESIINEFTDQCLSFFVEPPGDDLPEKFEILEERLKKRGNENSTLINRRLQRVSKELEFKEKEIFQYQIINEDINLATEQIESIIKENLK